ncbi:MAG TPA: hypothetical protein EYQ43_09270 [Methyloprofundus sp.]|uniref:SPOR domain-containing protein n=1 Tax=Methyloprofundus sp. TaxID=2020875 RepID=UPI001849544C|nr:SPOR domain-containing protein [Methyloprofundus sp.]HIG65720.1 hypothetical protein [Methyloprofundus sp.]
MAAKFISSLPYRIAALFLLFSTQLAQAETVSVPLKVEFPYLQQVLIKQLYREPLTTVEILNDPYGCSEIILSEPELSEFKQQLKINTRLKARLAVKVLDNCIPLLNWDGYAQILSKPLIKPDNPQVIYLQVIDSQLINQNQETLATGPLWDQARKYIHPLFDDFHMDLRPAINNIQTILPTFLPQHNHAQINSLLDSIQLDGIQVNSSGINGQLHFDIAKITAEPKPEPALNAQEQQLWQEKWHSMDAVLTYTIKHYAEATELQELRQILFDILLSSRYQLQQALQQDQANDPVRHWFINSWAQLLPVMQKISTANPEQAPLALMTMITATDALQALDQLGPAFGLDISIDGLRRLARLLNKNTPGDPLKYDDTIDPELRQLFRFDPDSDSNESNNILFNLWPIQTANAVSKRTLDNWIPETNELDAYLSQVRALLITSAIKSSAKSSMTAAQRDIFQKLVLTTAWQESCWRQYVVENKKFVPLHSSTGDTGIMQINENVWRGFVNRNKLRWSIAYNVETGSNILLKYMTRYAIKKGEHKHSGGLDNLARSTYSTYNGGPSQVARYRKSNTSAWQQKVDKAFHGKYLRVKQGEELAVAECLGRTRAAKTSNQPQAPKVSAKSKAPKNTSPEKQASPDSSSKKMIHDKRWVTQQAKNNFTLQLGSFSTQQAVRAFINQQSIKGNYAIYPVRKHSKQLYSVLYGYYSTRLRAENSSKQFKALKVWIRSFKDIK